MKKFCIFSILLAVFAACSKVEPEPGSFPEEKKGTVPSIDGLSSDSAVLYPSEYALSEDIFFSLSDADSVWTVPGSGVNACLSELSGGRWKVAVSSLASMGKVSSVEIRARNGFGNTTAYITLEKAFFDIDRSSFESAAAGASVIVQVSSNVGCNAAVAAEASSWIHTEQAQTDISVNIDRNTLFTQRTGKIFFSDSRGVMKKTFAVTQEAAIDYCKLEREALIALYDATDGKNWKSVTSTIGERDVRTEYWCTDKPISQWYGVVVGGDGHVIYISLDDMNLCGTLPEELGDLVYCQEFVVSNNHLSGPLPLRIGDMQALKSLQAGGNSFTGDLASSTLSKLASKLKLVSLLENNFTGTFPEWVGDMPQQCNFWLQGNCLSGVVPRKVQDHPRWNTLSMDGTGKTIGQVNMVQKEGYILTVD